MSDHFLLPFKNSYTIVPVIMIIAVLFLFTDSFFTEKELGVSSYLKTAVIAGVLAVLVVYVNDIKGIVGEEIITTAPPF